MKLSDVLSETPYLHPGAMSREIVLDGSYSIETIKREFTKRLGVISGTSILMDTNSSIVIGVAVNDKLTSQGRVLPTFVLMFKRRVLLKFPNKFPNVIQVDKVAIDPAKGNRGTMSEVYKLIVDSGFTLISDVTQYETAQGLWKKLARDRDYTMYVADIDHGLFKDSDGVPIVYDGTNISDQEIWSTGSDYDGQYRVLILTSCNGE